MVLEINLLLYNSPGRKFVLFFLSKIDSFLNVLTEIAPHGGIHSDGHHFPDEDYAEMAQKHRSILFIKFVINDK